jgi:hypothetical protein
MSPEQEAEMKRIAEQVRTLQEGGGSTDRQAVEIIARDSARPLIKLDKNPKGKQIWSVGSIYRKLPGQKQEKNKGGTVMPDTKKMSGPELTSSEEEKMNKLRYQYNKDVDKTINTSNPLNNFDYVKKYANDVRKVRR